MDNIDAVIERLQADRAFRMKYMQNPDKCLEAYLTPEEIRAIKTGDGHQLVRNGAGEKWEKLTAALCGPEPGP